MSEADRTSVVVSDLLPPFLNFCLSPVSDLRLSFSCFRFSKYSGGAEYCFFSDPLSAKVSSTTVLSLLLLLSTYSQCKLCNLTNKLTLRLRLSKLQNQLPRVRRYDRVIVLQNHPLYLQSPFSLLLQVSCLINEKQEKKKRKIYQFDIKLPSKIIIIITDDRVTWRVYCSLGLSKGITWKLSGSPGMLSMSIKFEHCRHTDNNEILTNKLHDRLK